MYFPTEYGLGSEICMDIQFSKLWYPGPNLFEILTDCNDS